MQTHLTGEIKVQKMCTANCSVFDETVVEQLLITIEIVEKNYRLDYTQYVQTLSNNLL